MKQRLDVLLVERGLVADYKLAAAMIMAGEVLVDGQRFDKPGIAFDLSSNVTLKTRSRYVSRGGDKLASVAASLGLNFNGQTVLDVGASTGGFTDYALQQGAVKVWAVDTGRGQMRESLRQDSRVEVFERTDVRELNELPRLVDVVLIDVSFVSLVSVLPWASLFLKLDGFIVALLKPQFEASKAVADRFKGVISDAQVRQEIINEFEGRIRRQFEIIAQADSQIAGAKGNRERFYKLRPRGLS